MNPSHVFHMCILFLWILFGPVQLLAQSGSYTMTGIVKAEKTGEPLPHASVKIQGTRLGALTNTDGWFTILEVPVDQAEAVVVSYLGYAEKSIPLDPNIETQNLIIELSTSEYVVEEVVIEAGTKQVMKSTGMSQISLNPAQIQNLPSLGERDIFRTLQLMPGVSGTNESSSGLYVRGGTPDQNLVLFDGFTVYHVDHFFGFFSAFNPNAVKDVQLYKGGFGAKYGGRLSSVVELTGKQGNTSEFDLDAGVGLLSGNLSLEIPLWKKGSILLSGRHSYPGLDNNLYNKIFDLFVEENVNPNVTDPSFQFYDANAKITLLPTDKDVVSVSFYNGQDDLDNSRVIDADRRRETPRGTVGVLIHNEISDLLSWGNWGVSGKWSRKWNPRWYSNMVLAWSNYYSQREQIANGEATIFRRDTMITRPLNNSFIEDNNVQDITLRLDNELKITTNHTLEFGTQLTSHDISYLYTRNDTTEILNRKDLGDLYAVYLQDVWTPMKGLEVQGGIRTTYFEPTNQIYWEPRVSASYGLESGLTFKAAWGKYQQFTNRIVREDVLNGSRDFWVLADGNDIPVGEAYHYIAGVSYEKGSYLIDVEAYEKRMSGLSEFSLRFSQERRGATPSANELFFTGTGVARGVETLVQKTQGKYTGWISYTLSEVVHNFPDLSDYAYYALHHQQHEIKIVQSLELGNWILSGSWVYASGKPYTAPGGLYELTTLNGDEYGYINVGSKNSERLPDYHRLDLSASYTMKIKRSRLQLGLSVFNLYNRRNIWYKEFEIQGNELIETDFQYLGTTPNLFLNFNLR
ncbi:MAG: carboxypeptidase-like regulatory domain-containing protein [Bacteroidota bacterium]